MQGLFDYVEFEKVLPTNNLFQNLDCYLKLLVKKTKYKYKLMYHIIINYIKFYLF